MFTGIITDIGKVSKIIKTGGSNKESWVDLTLGINSSYDMTNVEMGASIACNGVCLTVVKKSDGGYFEVDVSSETISKTTIVTWVEGDSINLERALKLGDELGGHLVSGHIDCVAKINDIKSDGESYRFIFTAPEEFMKYIAPKGSVIINGTSLTVNEVIGNTFGINVIPHTMENTIFKKNVLNDNVNFEVDLLSRYVARLLGKE